METIKEEERKFLHRMLDSMIDNNQPSMIWEGFFQDEPFIFKKKLFWLSIRIKDDEQ